MRSAPVPLATDLCVLSAGDSGRCVRCLRRAEVRDGATGSGNGPYVQETPRSMTKVCVRQQMYD